MTTVKDLKELCKKKGIKGYSNKKKHEIEKLLQDFQKKKKQQQSKNGDLKKLCQKLKKQELLQLIALKKEKQTMDQKSVKPKQKQVQKPKQKQVEKQKQKPKQTVKSKSFVFTNNIYTAPKEPEIAGQIPPSPNDTTFRNFIVSQIPELNYITVSNMKTLVDKDTLHKYHTISGAVPKNVIGRLAAVIGPCYHSFLTQGAHLPSIVTQEAHDKLRLIFYALQNHPRRKIFINQLLEGSKACINGIIQVINTVYNEINVVDSLENQILSLLEISKDLALDEFILKKHPSSNKPSVLNNISKASLQFAHMKNAYIKLLGKELGLRTSTIKLAHIDHYAKISNTIAKDVALKEIKSKIKLKDVVNAIMNDVNNEVCSIPHIIDRVKLTNWVYNIEYSGSTFDGKNYPQIDQFTENYIWDEASKNKFPSEPKNKNLAWLSTDSTLKILELEGFVKNK